jgi:hypothetical protein
MIYLSPMAHLSLSSREVFINDKILQKPAAGAISRQPSHDSHPARQAAEPQANSSRQQAKEWVDWHVTPFALPRDPLIVKSVEEVAASAGRPWSASEVRFSVHSRPVNGTLGQPGYRASCRPSFRSSLPG